MGGRSDIWPAESKTVVAYVADVAPELVEIVAVQVLSIERTFWEKATILHNESYRPAGQGRGDRVSRRYYDLVAIARNVPRKNSALTNRSLLARVIEHKKMYFANGWSQYDLFLHGDAQLVPSEEAVAGLRGDYEKMQFMFFAAPPSFDQILEELKTLQQEINSSS